MFDKIHKPIRMKELPFPVEVVATRRRKKTVSIEVYPTRVVMRVPINMPKAAIYDLIETRKPWLIGKWDEVQNRAQPSPSDSEMNDSNAVRTSQNSLPEQVYVYGQAHTVVPRAVERGANRRRFTLRQNNRVVEILTPDAPFTNQDLIHATRHLVVDWLRQSARRDFLLRLEKWTATMSVVYREFRLKDQKTRWGSCSSLGNINLNWRLIQAPEWIIDYVVIHELAHLIELNHSPAFWNIVKKHCPQYQEAKRWLKVHGPQLLEW